MNDEGNINFRLALIRLVLKLTVFQKDGVAIENHPPFSPFSPKKESKWEEEEIMELMYQKVNLLRKDEA